MMKEIHQSDRDRAPTRHAGTFKIEIKDGNIFFDKACFDAFTERLTAQESAAVERMLFLIGQMEMSALNKTAVNINIRQLQDLFKCFEKTERLIMEASYYG